MTTTDAMTHPLDEAIALKSLAPDRWQGATSPNYANMVGPFGGTTAATLLTAVLSHEALLGEPVSLTVNFAAPVADGPFEVSARPLRSNRSTQHWWVEMRQSDELVASATAVTAIRRDTWGATQSQFPDVPPAPSLASADGGDRPVWTHQYDMRFVDGALMGEPDPVHPSRSRLWMRDEPARPLDFPALSALCDVFIPRIFICRPRLVPVGTVSMTIYFHADAAQLAAVGSEHVLGVAWANQMGMGYFDQSAEVWSGQGSLLATTHQVVYFRE